MLENYDEFIEALVESPRLISGGAWSRTGVMGDIYCSRCGGPRRVRVTNLHGLLDEDKVGIGVSAEAARKAISELYPMLFPSCSIIKCPPTRLTCKPQA